MLQNTDPANTNELSPVKRALLEIRHLRAELEDKKRAQSEPIAIVGTALRLPGGVSTPERFWQALAGGEDLISNVPTDRWEAREYLNSDPDHVGTMYDSHGGFLTDIDEFDAEFFGINPREAASMDPQQRLLLQLSWEALERANINPKTLMNTPGGVFLGMSGSDYARQSMRDTRDIHAYSAVGSAMSIAAGRISYFFGLRGPSLVVDTACSSSLVVTHLACESLRRGEINLAIVGGSNLMLAPDFNVSFSRTRMLARDGRCKTFDVAADGYVRAEGCCVVVLKRASDALRDRDRILANIVGSAVNQDGRSAGITAPNGPSQEEVISKALQNAGIKPSSISYVEAHGTGTPLGDPIEVQALGAVYGATHSKDAPLYIGSVKTNLGHTEAASGLVGMLKVIQMMAPDHGIAPHIHFKQSNPKIDFERLHIEVPTRLTSWHRSEDLIYAGVSSFGFSGTNAHAILSSAAPVSTDLPLTDDVGVISDKYSTLVISAKQEIQLRRLVERYVEFLGETKHRIEDICYSASVGRAVHSHRLIVNVRSAQDARKILQRWLSGETVSEVSLITPDSPEANLFSPPTFGEASRRVDIPVYPFQKKKFWFESSPEVKRNDEREKRWESAIAVAARQSLVGPLGWRLELFPEKWELLHLLTLAYAQNVFVEAAVFNDSQWIDVDEVMARAEIEPIYRKLVERWLTGLSESGVILASGQRFSATDSMALTPLEPLWLEVEKLLEDDPGTLAYLRQCGKLLASVVRGRTSALETLFPDGSFVLTEGIYESGIIARYFNSIVAAVIADTAREIGKTRNARILEIGGGTGGTTSAVVPLLSSGQVEYCFTDLSEMFLARARNKFAAYTFINYAIFDLDRALEEQGRLDDQFDIILAANSVHASRNLNEALCRVRKLLAPGGVLVLLESTQHHSWFDMSTGLIEGWQHFEDDRLDNPLLEPEQWRVVLDRNGFNELAIFPAKDLPTSVLGQHVLIARSTSSVERSEESRPLHRAISGLKAAAGSSVNTVVKPSNTALVSRLRSLGQAEQVSVMLEFVRTTICRVFQLGMQPEELGVRDRLSDLGMDSLIALELRAELAKGLGSEIQISSTIAFDTGTVGELSNALLMAIASHSIDFLESQESSPLSKVSSNLTTVTAQQLSEMSEDEVEKLLNERLSKR